MGAVRDESKDYLYKSPSVYWVPEARQTFTPSVVKNGNATFADVLGSDHLRAGKRSLSWGRLNGVWVSEDAEGRGVTLHASVRELRAMLRGDTCDQCLTPRGYTQHT